MTGADSSTEHSEVASNVESDDASSDQESDQVSDNSDVEGDPTACRGLVKRMRRSPLFERDGARILWNGQTIGTISSWGNSVSCRCSMHPSCRSPASTRWGSDATLENWLLEAIDEAGARRIDKAEHQQKMAALHVHVKRR